MKGRLEEEKKVSHIYVLRLDSLRKEMVSLDGVQEEEMEGYGG